METKRILLLIGVLSLISASGIRSCSRDVTIGYPAVALIVEESGAISPGSWHAFAINILFGAALYVACRFFFASDLWRRSMPARAGLFVCLTALVWDAVLRIIMIATIVFGQPMGWSTDLIRNLYGIPNPLFWAFLTFGILIFDHFLTYLPFWTSLYPHRDDLVCRIALTLALVLLFVVGWGIGKIGLKLKGSHS